MAGLLSRIDPACHPRDTSLASSEVNQRLWDNALVISRALVWERGAGVTGNDKRCQRAEGVPFLPAQGGSGTERSLVCCMPLSMPPWALLTRSSILLQRNYKQLHYSAITAQLQCNHNASAVQLQYNYSAATVQLQCNHSTNTVQIQLLQGV